MICIVGALAVDVLVSRKRFLKSTSNPASIRLRPGGVGYRIYSHLETPKLLFTALGSDILGRWLMEEIAEPRGIEAIRVEGGSTSCYCAFLQDGELLYGASDMSVIEESLSWASLRSRLPALGARDFLVIEANLSVELVKALLHWASKRTRVVFESVSVEKLLRHTDALRDLYLLCANQQEFEALGNYLAVPGRGKEGSAGRGSRSERWMPEFMKQRRIAQILVSRGKRGASLYRLTGEKARRLDLGPKRILAVSDTTGAGDRLLSGFLEQIELDPDPQAALRAAIAAVERAIEEGTL